MENPLANIDSLVKHDVSVFKDITKSGDYLPRIQLMTSASDKCKDGSFPINHYALVKDQAFKDVGDAVDVLVLTWRPKALEIGEEVISVFDPKHPEFMRIQEKSSQPNSGCMFGPEFLLYIPSQKEFATFFCGSKSARREAPILESLVTKPATLKSRLIDNKKYKWQAPAVVPCSTPFELPTMESIKDVVSKFNNPPVTSVEIAEEGDGAAGRTR